MLRDCLRCKRWRQSRTSRSVRTSPLFSMASIKRYANLPFHPFHHVSCLMLLQHHPIAARSPANGLPATGHQKKQTIQSARTSPSLSIAYNKGMHVLIFFLRTPHRVSCFCSTTQVQRARYLPSCWRQSTASEIRHFYHFAPLDLPSSPTAKMQGHWLLPLYSKHTATQLLDTTQTHESFGKCMRTS